MSPLAKIFVLLNFVLAVLFFAASATLYLTRTDWREKYEGYKETVQTDLGKVETRNGQLTVANDELTDNVQKLQSEVDKATADLQRANQTLASARRDAQVARNEMSQFAAFQEASEKRANAAAERVQALQGQLQAAGERRDQATTAMDGAVQERNRMRLTLDQTQQELGSARDATSDLEQKLEELTLRYDALAERCPQTVGEPPMPPIEARVIAVDPDQKLVVLSVGREQKVENGFEFTVYRGDSFVGKVKVIRVYPDLAGARIMYTKDGGVSVRQGDRASTRL